MPVVGPDSLTPRSGKCTRVKMGLSRLLGGEGFPRLRKQTDVIKADKNALISYGSAPGAEIISEL